MFIPLDIYHNVYHNKTITKRNRLEAWLTFFCEDDPEEILKLIKEYPEFENLYMEVYRLCRNLEKIMGLFSEELAILDENTVKYMIDEMQEKLDAKDKELDAKDKELDAKNKEIMELKRMLGCQKED